MKVGTKMAITVVALSGMYVGVFFLAEVVNAADRRIASTVTSPTIDPATCAVYMLAGHMANAETSRQLAETAAYYEDDLGMEHFAAVDRARQELVRSAFEMCAFLQQSALDSK